jgi:hypothetical protein
LKYSIGETKDPIRVGLVAQGFDTDGDYGFHLFGFRFFCDRQKLRVREAEMASEEKEPEPTKAAGCILA